MTLELSPIEVTDLRESLQAFNRQLLGELARADQRQYREMLREKVQRFEALAARLEAAMSSRPRVA